MRHHAVLLEVHGASLQISVCQVVTPGSDGIEAFARRSVTRILAGVGLVQTESGSYAKLKLLKQTAEQRYSTILSG